MNYFLKEKRHFFRVLDICLIVAIMAAVLWFVKDSKILNLFAANSTVTGSIATENTNDTESEDIILTTVLNAPGTAETVNWFVGGNSLTALNYSFNREETGTAFDTVTDYSGNNFHGQLGGGNVSHVPLWTSLGKSGGAYNFDGSGDFIEDVDATFLNGKTAFSLSLWVKSDTTNTDKGMISGKDPDGQDNVFNLRYDAAGFAGGENEVIKFGITVNGTDQKIESSGNVQTTSWQHIVVTWSSGNPIKLYLDGVEDVLSDEDAPQSGGLSGMTKFVVGLGSKDTAGTEGWDGLIDEIKIFDREITQEQVALLFNSGTPNDKRISKFETAQGEAWQAQVTPTDAVDDGTVLTTNSITLAANSVPSGTILLEGSGGGDASVGENIVLNNSVTDADGNTLFLTPGFTVNAATFSGIAFGFNKRVVDGTNDAVIDSSGNSQHGQLGAGTVADFPTWVSSPVGGPLGSAYEFSKGGATNTHIQIPHDSALDFGTSDLTFSAWIFPHNVSTENQVIIEKYSTNVGFRFHLNGGKIKLIRGDNFGEGPDSDVGAIVNNQWQHIVAVADADNNSVTYFVNGVSRGGGVLPNSNWSSGTRMAIGAKGNAGSSAVGFDGLIDEVRIYKRAFSTAQVLREYNSGTPDYNTIVFDETNQGDQWSLALYATDQFADFTATSSTITISANTLPTTTGSISAVGGDFNANGVSLSTTPTDTDGQTVVETVSWLRNNAPIAPLVLPFNTRVTVGTAGAITDYSSLNHHGQLIQNGSSALPLWLSNGVKGGAYQFDGAGNAIHVPHHADFDFGTSDFSLEAWVNTTANAASFPFIVSKDDTSGSRQGYTLLIQQTVNQPKFEVFIDGTQAAVQGDTAINDGAWHHLVGVRDGANLTLYVDGVSKGTTAHPSGAGNVNTTVDLAIAGRADNTAAVRYTGLIDEVRVYNRALSSAQVVSNYNSGSSSDRAITSSETTLGGITTITSRITLGSNDAEENLNNNSVGLGSSDLDLATDTGNGNAPTMMGLRFSGLQIPQGAVISEASLSLMPRATDSTPTSFTFVAEDVDNSAAFTNTNANLSGRDKTTASVTQGTVPTWTDDVLEVSGGLASLIQEVVDRPGWEAGNALSLFITGTGDKRADTFEGGPSTAPLLTVKFNNATGESWQARVSPNDSIGDGTVLVTNKIDNDGTGPKLNSVSRVDDNTVRATFDEPMTVSGVQNTSNWALVSAGADNGSISVSTITDTGDATSFDIDLSQNMIVNTNYTFTITGVQDAANVPNNVDTNNNSQQYFHAAGVLNVASGTTTIASGDTSKENFEINCDGGATTLVINGTHTFAKVTLTNGCGMTHDISTLSTINKMDLTILSTLNICSSCKIDVRGKGFLGGGSGGAGNAGRVSDGAGGQQDGLSAHFGGSHGGIGGVLNVGNTPNPIHDSLVNPVSPGDGGGNANSGSNHNTDGGGAVIITAQNLILDGEITADGNQNSSRHGGAGGTVNLTVNGTFSGNGTISADGGPGGSSQHGGGGGRVAIKAATNTFNVFPPTNITALGSKPESSAFEENGSAGTIYIEQLGVDTANQGRLYMNNNSTVSTTVLSNPNRVASEFTVGGGNFKEIEIVGGAEFISPLDLTVSGDVTLAEAAFRIENGTLTAQNLTAATNTVISHGETDNSTIKKLTLNISGNLTVDASSSINVEGRGFRSGPNGGQTSDGVGGQQLGSSDAAGSHGGLGGKESSGGNKNVVYDNVLNPGEPGGGGDDGGSDNDFDGGGVILITAGTLNLNGSISASALAATGNDHDGAGGTVNINAGTLTGSGSISADGAGVETSTRTGGGGGRVAIRYTNNSLFTIPPTNITAIGGEGFDSDNRRQGGAGTIYFEQSGVHTTNQGVLIISNGNSGFTSDNRTTPITTSVLTPNTGTFSEIHVLKEAKADFLVDINVGTINLDDTFSAMGHTGSADAILTFDQLNLTNAATISSALTDGATFHPLTLVGGNISIDGTSKVGMNVKGFGAGEGPGFEINDGGTHGGSGENNSTAIYGSLENPVTAGSGADGIGGGVLIISAGNIVNNGTIQADGNSNTDSAAGGSINFSLTGTLSGTGTVTALGGSGSDDGGGGRIALRNGNFTLPFNNFNVSGGGGQGGYGTVFLNTHGVTFESLSGTLGTDMEFTYRLFDNTAATVGTNRNIVAEFSTDGGTTFATATDGGGTSEGKTNLTSSASPGVQHVFVWDSAADIGVNNQAVFRIRSSLNNSNGETLGTKGEVCVGAGCPVLAQITTPSTTETNDVTINYNLISSDNALTALVVEYSDDGGNSFNAATQGSGGDALTGLTSSLGGTAHTFVWDSATDLGNTDQSDIQFRILPTGGVATTTSNFRVDNNEPPVATIISPEPACGALVTTPTTVTYTLTDSDSDALSVVVEFSTDGGNNFSTATSSGGDDGLTGLTSSPGGTNHTFNWNLGADIVNTSSSQVQFRVTPSDPLNGNGTLGTTASFSARTDTPPSANITVPTNTSGHNIAIEYTLTDLQSDSLTIVPEVSGDAGATFIPATEASSGSEGTSNLSSSVGGVSHVFVWNASSDVLTSGDIIFRLRISDASLGTCSQTTPFFYEFPSSGTASRSTNSPKFLIESQGGLPEAPQIEGFEVLDDNTIRWVFKDNAENETGFKLEDENGVLIKDTGIIFVKNLEFFVEENLVPETEYCRQVKATNFFGESIASPIVCAVIEPEEEQKRFVLIKKDPEKKVANLVEKENISIEEEILIEENSDEKEVNEDEIDSKEKEENQKEKIIQNNTEKDGETIVPCSKEESLVCGEDGNTYINQCFAERAGVKVRFSGTCQTEEIKIAEALPEKDSGEFFYEGNFGAQVKESTDTVVKIIGEVEPLDEGVIISGITEPNVLVTIYVNDYIAFKTISDEEGNWQIEVLHEDITRDRGVELEYIIDASIKRLDPLGGVLPKESSRVQISELKVLIPSEGEVAIAFQGGLKRLEVSQKDIDIWSDVLGEKQAVDLLTTLKVGEVLLEDTIKLIEENEEDIRAGLAVSMPVVVAVNPVVVASLPHLPIYIYHVLSWLLGVLGIRKQRKAWGVAYNSITKMPLPLAIVRLYELKKVGNATESTLVETQVTDKFGRFGFLPQKGKYLIEIVKDQYQFPSSIVGKEVPSDGERENLYHGQLISIKSKSSQLSFDVPVDPISAKSLEIKSQKFLNLLRRFKSGAKHIAFPALVLGMLFSLSIVFVEPLFINFVLLGFYGACLMLHVFLSPKNIRPWGTVMNIESKEPVSLATVSIVDKKFNHILKTRLSDYEGRFFFFPPEGEYQLIVEKDGYKVSKSNNKKFYQGESFVVNENSQIINKDVPLTKKK